MFGLVGQTVLSMHKKLKLWQWILIVALTGTVPLVILSVFLIHHSINKSIAFGEQELRGVRFQRPLEQLLDLLPRYQSAARQALGGMEIGRQNLAAIQAQLDAAFAALSANYNGKLGLSLKFTDAELAARKRDEARLTAVLAEWQNLKNAPLVTAAAGESVSKLVAATRTMIAHAGDLSNLILDTDLDSYYLVDITLSALPQTQQRLSDTILQVGAWLRSGEVDSNRTQIAITAAMLQQDDQDRITGDAQTSLAEDPNFYGVSETLQTNLPPALDKYTAANQVFVGMLNRIAAGQKVSPEELEAAGWNARTESFRLWDTGATELDRLLAVRIASFQRQLWMSFAAIGVVLALVSVANYLIVRKLNSGLVAFSGNLRLVSTEVAASAGQVSNASQSLAEGASEQAASIEQTSASLEELASMTRRHTDNSQKANQLSKETRTAADKGMGDMQLMNSAMAAIKSSSDDIANIIKTIDEIAFQTNILALNAAVEAARAGEAGMGFAVVADEVRNLALRSAQAAKETAVKIEDAITKTSQGVVLSQKVTETLNDIARKTRQVDDLAAETAGASAEQSQGIAQINTAIGQMDKVTQNNAANAEESAAAAQQLHSQAAIMNQSVAELLELVGYRNRGSAPQPVLHPILLKKSPATPSATKTRAGRNGRDHLTGKQILPPGASRPGNQPFDANPNDF